MRDKKSISLLIKIMKEQLEAYKELLNLAEKKSDVLVKGDVKLLGEITETEQQFIVVLGSLEEKRTKLIDKIATAYQKDFSEAEPDFLKNVLDGEESKAMSAIQDEFKSVLEELEVKNSRNEELIKSALDYIDFSIKLLTNAGEGKANYDIDGVNPQKAFQIIDKKA